MIPALVVLPGTPWDVLPPGVHATTLADVEAVFATNPRRRDLFSGLVSALHLLRRAGCSTVFIDGSYVTGKPNPGDFDACWDPTGVDGSALDPRFLDFKNSRAGQKAAFKGEFFPSAMMCSDVGKVFVEFFQVDRFTGKRKGIVSIAIQTDPMLSRTMNP